MQFYEPGNSDITDAIVSRLEDSQLGSNPTFLDVSATGDSDVKTAAILCLVKLARHREKVCFCSMDLSYTYIHACAGPTEMVFLFRNLLFNYMLRTSLVCFILARNKV